MDPGNRGYGAANYHQEGCGIFDPEHRMPIEEQVSNGPAAYRGDGGNENDYQKVET